MHGPKYDSEIYRNAAYYIVFNMIMIQKKTFNKAVVITMKEQCYSAILHFNRYCKSKFFSG